MAEGMADAQKLEGYLMKEKWKSGFLHGLTGDVNRRYFRVRTIEGSEELALCYYKNEADPEVRGWTYLSDVTEIAENQDTLILTSVARTLHLYAQTRAEHNVWIEGLARLCPGAFIKLGRNAHILKQDRDTTTIAKEDKPGVGDACQPSVFQGKDAERPSASLQTADPPNRENIAGERKKRGKIQTERDSAKKSGASRCLESSECRACGSSPCDDLPARRHPLVGGGESEPSRMMNSPGGGGEKMPWASATSKKSVRDGGSSKSRDQEQERRRSSHTVRTRERATDVDDEGGASVESLDDKVIGSQCVKVVARDAILRKAEEGPLGSMYDSCALQGPKAQEIGRTTVAKSRESGLEESDDTMTAQTFSFSCPSGKENVETTELDGRLRHDIAEDGNRINSIDHDATLLSSECQGSNGDSPGDVSRQGFHQDQSCNNQEHHLDAHERLEIGLPTEILPWEGPRSGKSATTRLHRHISGTDGETSDSSTSLPQSKEIPAKYPSVSAGSQASWNDGPSTSGQRPLDSRALSVNGTQHPARVERRTSGADLEWTAGAEALDRSQGCEDNLDLSANKGPFDPSESDDGEACDLDMEIKRQRRRAMAAVRALEAAAKEADEGVGAEGGMMDERTNDIDFGYNGGIGGDGAGMASLRARRKGGIPSPKEPPPPAILRKGRAWHERSRPGMAPPKLPPHLRSKPSWRGTGVDENFASESWDDEIDAPDYSSSAMAEMGGQLPRAPPVCEFRCSPTSGVGHIRRDHWVDCDD